MLRLSIEQDVVVFTSQSSAKPILAQLIEAGVVIVGKANLSVRALTFQLD